MISIYFYRKNFNTYSCKKKVPTILFTNGNKIEGLSVSRDRRCSRMNMSVGHIVVDELETARGVHVVLAGSAQSIALLVVSKIGSTGVVS